MAINPLTGLDDGDPAPLPASPLFAVNRDAPMVPGISGAPAGLPPLGVSVPPVASAPPSALPAAPPVSLPPTALPPALPLARPAAHGARAPSGPSAEQRQIADVNAGELAAGAGLGEANAKKAEALAAGKANEVAVRQQQEADAQNLLNAKLAEKSKVDAQAAADAEAARKGGFRSYWADKDIGTKILAAISVGLSGVGQAFQAKAGRAPGENMALTAINAAIAQDWQLQKESIAKLEKQAQESGADAKHISAEVALMQASHAKNALDLAVAQTEQQAAAQGPDVARAASQGVLAQLKREQLEAGQKFEVTKAQVAEMRAGTVLKYAEAAKERAAATAAAAGNTGQSRAATKMMEQATWGTQMQTDLKELRPLMKNITPEVLRQAQLNEKRMQSADHGGWLGVLGYGIGAVPSDRYAGMSAPAARAMYLHDVLLQKAATVLAGQGHENHKEMAQVLQMARSDTPQGRMGKLEQMQDIAASAVRLGKQYSVEAQAAKDEERAKQASVGPLKVSPEDKARLMQFIRQNPSDPRAAKARALLGIGGPVAGM